MRSRVWGCFSVLAAAALAACGASGGTDGTAGGGGGGASGAGAGTGAGGSGGGIVLDSGSGGGGDAAACEQSVDIVFVMDVSTSMGPFLTKLAGEIEVVDQAVQALGLPAPPRYGLAVFVDDVLFVNNGQPYSDVKALKADFQTWSSFTSSNKQVNSSISNSTWPENSLDAIYAAAAQFAWRPLGTVQRLVIHTTDDTFWQGPGTNNGVNVLRNYGETLQILQSNQIRVFSFAEKLGGSCECLDVTAGFFAPYLGSPALPGATGGGVFELNRVMSNQVSLSASINGAVSGTLCEPYPTPR